MAKPVVRRPAAVDDIDAIADWLASEASADIARRFIDVTENILTLLGEQPAIGSTRHAEWLPDMPYPLRFHPVRGFPRLLIYYMDCPRHVEVIRVWDAARGLESLLDTTG